MDRVNNTDTKKHNWKIFRWSSLVRWVLFSLFRGDFGSGLLDLHAMDDTELLYEEEFIQSGSQIEPPRMHMIYLPYSDDIRLVEEVENCNILTLFKL
ncbi:kinesin-like protein KIN-13A isoform X3 [Vigna radiata var. radiata]|uniref:Kinesin-like protein KIN-13A isoform X3 n=1 Tax=Vigna radiata var. radiata TaxID=3916 RepID=A0A3Q0EJH8_VIGRR|nr:kinesin-like protein KIN-13A isoform X3 [Vigna radiata var. radiata]